MAEEPDTFESLLVMSTEELVDTNNTCDHIIAAMKKDIDDKKQAITAKEESIQGSLNELGAEKGQDGITWTFMEDHKNVAVTLPFVDETINELDELRSFLEEYRKSFGSAKDQKFPAEAKHVMGKIGTSMENMQMDPDNDHKPFDPLLAVPLSLQHHMENLKAQIPDGPQPGVTNGSRAASAGRAQSTISSLPDNAVPTPKKKTGEQSQPVRKDKQVSEAQSAAPATQATSGEKATKVQNPGVKQHIKQEFPEDAPTSSQKKGQAPPRNAATPSSEKRSDKTMNSGSSPSTPIATAGRTSFMVEQLKRISNGQQSSSPSPHDFRSNADTTSPGGDGVPRSGSSSRGGHGALGGNGARRGNGARGGSGARGTFGGDPSGGAGPRGGNDVRGGSGETSPRGAKNSKGRRGT